ncbi:NADPH:quinone oxidoreductase family protein [Saccharopolyspora sp. HNM0986]|uniref:NADPH:quinone oxidoreductase family protein n=1 Tax=Saccharopolyspora galaxeae TaxID=2781241 RepID=UPI00190AAAEA|nr:NADPH:quinone oxidoreductase family protein [Saccharopolyspora sp. HNM0986]MBK0866578.1 NADPH:quinone oxidoreductase family protein [Saccharopolyspora sp. HNM0986]
MRAVQITELTGPDSVRVADAEDPAPGPGQVLIEVRAAGVTFPDVLMTRGEYQIKPDPPFVPGSEVAGVVREAAEGFEQGQRVAAFPGIGGFAELAAVDAERVFPLPEQVPFDAAAGMPMNYLTVHFALARRGRLRAGETVLVHGASGGVGTAAVQLASVLGARVIAVVSQESKVEAARSAGAQHVVLAEGFRDAVAELVGKRGVDLVVDPVGGDRFTDSLRTLRDEGRLLVIGFTAGEIPTVKVNRLLLNNLDVVGVGWGAFCGSRPEYPRQQWQELLPHVESGGLRTLVGSTHPFQDAAHALRELDQRRAAGKVLLRP